MYRFAWPTIAAPSNLDYHHLINLQSPSTETTQNNLLCSCHTLTVLCLRFLCPHTLAINQKNHLPKSSKTKTGYLTPPVQSLPPIPDTAQLSRSLSLNRPLLPIRCSNSPVNFTVSTTRVTASAAEYPIRRRLRRVNY